MTAVTTLTRERGPSNGGGLEEDINTWDYARSTSQEVLPYPYRPRSSAMKLHAERGACKEYPLTCHAPVA